ncbi:MAG: hypothetical protein U7M05_12450, partial [Candidatus Igneacidithiobacillus chanchocoensis]
GYLPPWRKAAVWRVGLEQDWGLNPFLLPVDPYLIVDELILNMIQVWGETAIGPRSQDILRHVFLAVFQLRKEAQGLLKAQRLLQSWMTWGKLAKRMPSGPVRDWFAGTAASWQENPRLGAEATAPPLNKLGALLFSPAMRSALAPAKTLDLDRLIEDKCVLIVSLSGGDIGDENAAILGVILLSSIWQSLRRAGFSNPAITSIVLDEAHRFVCPSFAKLLAEGRSFGAQSTVAFQFWAQIRNEEVQGSLRELLQNLFIFRTSQMQEALQTSQLLARVYGNLLSPSDEAQDALNIGPDDLVNLPNYRAVVRLVDNGNPQPPFLGTTIPLTPVNNRIPWGMCPEEWLRQAAEEGGEGEGEEADGETTQEADSW